MNNDNRNADITLIKRILPHRYPFLLVDKVFDIDGFKNATGLKNITFNEPQFQGHFPNNPIMKTCDCIFLVSFIYINIGSIEKAVF